MEESKQQFRKMEERLHDNNSMFDEYNKRLEHAEKLLKFT